jgi:hypothetical protein
VDCLSAEPLGLREEVSSELVESLETRDSDDDRAECAARCDVTYGLRLLEERVGSGEYGLLPG